ncbi:MAG: lactobin A/cerein 7B family class IIb bacteriocin [Bacteroides sp.]|nr:lactobin A/cerein 7B family class IIb bacteriocin [Bacteroides sp.]
MKNLNENALMQEMNVNEMQEMNGGIPGLVWLAIGVLVSEALDRNAGNDFMDGWNAAKK